MCFAVTLGTGVTPESLGFIDPRVLFVHGLVPRQPTSHAFKGLLAEILEGIFGVLLGVERLTGLRPRTA